MQRFFSLPCSLFIDFTSSATKLPNREACASTAVFAMIALCSAGYILVKTNGPTLTVLRATEETVLRVALLFKQTFGGNITCIDIQTTEIEGCDGHVKVQLAVGLEDGQVLYCEHMMTSNTVSVSTQHSPQWRTMANLSIPIKLLRIAAGFVVCVATSDGAAVMQLLYYNQSSTSTGQTQASVDMQTYTCIEDDVFSTTQSWCIVSSAPSCITVISALDCADEETCGFVGAYFGAHVLSALYNTGYHNKISGSMSSGPVPEQVLVLVGCIDGTVWWFLSPIYSVVMQLPNRGMDVVGAEDSPVDLLRLQATLLGRYATQISHIMESSSSSIIVGGNKVQCRSLLIVEDSGAVNMLTAVDCCKHSTALQLPLSADVSTVTCLWGAYLLYICCDTGALCAACPAIVTNDDGVNNVHDMRSISHNSADDIQPQKSLQIEGTALTPESCPYIENYSMCCSRTGAHIVLHAGAAYRVCKAKLPCNNPESAQVHAHNGGSSSANAVHNVQHGAPTITVEEGLSELRTACGMRRHPHTLVPAPGHSSTSIAQITQEQQLQSTLSSIKAHQQQCMDVLERTMQAENEIVQLQCLLELLGPLMPLYTPTGAVSPSHTLSNCNQSLQLQYSFRSEPSIAGSGAGCSTYMDIFITASTVSAMRALQGRTLTVTLASTQPSTSIHCSTVTNTLGVNFMASQSVNTTHATHNNSAHCGDTTHMYSYRCSVPVRGLAQLSSYRLSVAIPVHIENEIQPAATVMEDGIGAHLAGGASVCLVDQILTSTHMLQYVLQSSEYVSAQNLQALLCTQESTHVVGGASNTHSIQDRQRKLCVTVPTSHKVHCEQLLAEWHRCINMYTDHTPPSTHTVPPILHSIPHSVASPQPGLTQRPIMLSFTHTSKDNSNEGRTVYMLEGHSAEALAHVSAELHRILQEHLSVQSGVPADADSVCNTESSAGCLFHDGDLQYLDEHRQQVTIGV